MPGEVAGRVVGALGGSPALLVVVLLNAAMIGAAGYYLLALEKNRQSERDRWTNIIERCIARPPGAQP